MLIGQCRSGDDAIGKLYRVEIETLRAPGGSDPQHELRYFHSIIERNSACIGEISTCVAYHFIVGLNFLSLKYFYPIISCFASCISKHRSDLKSSLLVKILFREGAFDCNTNLSGMCFKYFWSYLIIDQISVLFHLI